MLWVPLTLVCSFSLATADAFTKKVMHELTIDEVKIFQKNIFDFVNKRHPEVMVKLREKKDYDDEMAKIFDQDLKAYVDEIKQLIAMNELPKARDIFTSAIFDIGWKERLLNKLGGEFRNLVKAHVRLEDERSEREAEMQLRIPHCYKCKKPLNNLSTSRCSICRWINCYECNATSTNTNTK